MTSKRQPKARKNNVTTRKVERVSTHADIAAFFNHFWGKQQEPTHELRKISLLPEISPPAWEVSYVATFHSSYGDRYVYGELLVLQLNREDGTPYLNLASPVELPAGFSTPQEEDAEIERRKLAQDEAWRKRWETERAQKQVQGSGTGIVEQSAQSQKEERL